MTKDEAAGTIAIYGQGGEQGLWEYKKQQRSNKVK